MLAEELAAKSGRPVFYLASMQILNDDPEQIRRLNAHKQRRPAEWKTIDAPFSAEQVVAGLENNSLVIFDCLSLYITNMLIAGSCDDIPGRQGSAEFALGHADPYERETDILQKVDALLLQMEAKSAIEFIVVSNEVGWGVVPESALSRAFRDILGLANQRVAARAEKAFLMCAGLRISLK